MRAARGHRKIMGARVAGDVLQLRGLTSWWLQYCWSCGMEKFNCEIICKILSLFVCIIIRYLNVCLRKKKNYLTTCDVKKSVFEFSSFLSSVNIANYFPHSPLSPQIFSFNLYLLCIITSKFDWTEQHFSRTVNKWFLFMLHNSSSMCISLTELKSIFQRLLTNDSHLSMLHNVLRGVSVLCSISLTGRYVFHLQSYIYINIFNNRY